MKYFCPNCQGHFPNKNCPKCRENFESDENEDSNE
jgi:predicted amidophosphoribosyltransferase